MSHTTTRLDRTAERATDIITTPARGALPIIVTGQVENTVGGDHVTVGRRLLHFPVTDICNHNPQSTENIIQGMFGVSINIILLY